MLASLREQYDEPEALTRFNAYMESEGYTVTAAPPSLASVNAGSASFSAMSYSNPFGGLTMLFGETGQYLSENLLSGKEETDSNLVLQSRLHAATVDGETQLFAESTAYYRVNSADDSGNAFSFMYEKKITDTFETGADSFIADAFGQPGGAEDSAMREALESAVTTGEPIGSEMTRGEYESTLPRLGSTMKGFIAVEPFRQTLTIMRQDANGDWQESGKVTYDGYGNVISPEQQEAEAAAAAEAKEAAAAEAARTGSDAFDTFLQERTSGLDDGAVESLRRFFQSVAKWMNQRGSASGLFDTQPYLLMREDIFSEGKASIEDAGGTVFWAGKQ